MNLLSYEFIDGPDGSINGMLRTLVRELRYNRSQVTIDEFRQAMPALNQIEATLQRLDSDISKPKRNYISEIMAELDLESENEINIVEDLQRSTVAVIDRFLNRSFDFSDLSYITGRAEHYHWVQFSGYLDARPVDSELILAKEVFRSICNKYNYIFVDLS